MNKIIKTALASAIFSCLSIPAMAHIVEYEPSDSSVDSKICAVAANEGIRAAQSYARKESINFIRMQETISCNGMSIQEVASKGKAGRKNVERDHAQHSLKERFIFIANDERSDTQLCIAAAEGGLRSDAYKLAAKKELACNGKDVRDFVLSLK